MHKSFSPQELTRLSQAIQSFSTLSIQERFDLLEELRPLAHLSSIEAVDSGQVDSVCPVHREALRLPCGLKQCVYWTEHSVFKNCSLNFMMSQQKEKLTIQQFSFLYKKSPERIDSIYKHAFKIVQHHYLRDVLRAKGAACFSMVPGFCVTCQSKLWESELNDQALYLGGGFGYCSTECKKQHPPQYYEIEKFFGASFLKVVEVGSELFNFYYLEELLGFQPNVLRNRLEKIRDEKKNKKISP